MRQLYEFRGLAAAGGLVVMALTEVAIVPKLLFLLSWGMLNSFWLMVSRRPGVSAVNRIFPLPPRNPMRHIGNGVGSRVERIAAIPAVVPPLRPDCPGARGVEWRRTFCSLQN